jgi:hypothetical protein
MNTEVRREIYLTLYQLMSDYMTKLGGMAQMLTSPEVPSDMKKIIMDASDKSVYILNKILENFPDIKDADEMIVDMSEVVDAEKLLQMSPDMQPPPPPPEQQGMPQEGMPPEGMPPGGPEGMPPEQMPPGMPGPDPMAMMSPEQMLMPPEK